MPWRTQAALRGARVCAVVYGCVRGTAGGGMASARNVLDALNTRSPATPTLVGMGAEEALPLPPPLKAGAPRLDGAPLPMVVSQRVFRTVSSPSPGTSLAQLLEESRAARNSLTKALSPRNSPRPRAATAVAPPSFNLGPTDAGAVVAAAAGALKKVEVDPEDRGPVRPRQASMPITPVYDEYAADGTSAGGDAAFAQSPAKGPSASPEGDWPVDRTCSVEPECVAPVIRPRRASKKPATGRASSIWSRREVEAEADAEQELTLLRQQRTR